MEIQPEYCQVDDALEIIVGKWKPIIILTLIKDGTMRFNELRRAIPNVTQKMLTKHLRELEAEDIVHRKVYAEVPPRVEYTVTEYGKTLQPILMDMHEWGIQHQAHMAKLRESEAEAS